MANYLAMNDRAGFLFVFVVLLLFGLYSVLSPKAVKKENADVPGFPKTGFAWMPVWGWNRRTRRIWIFPLPVSKALGYTSAKTTCPQR